MAKKKTEDSNKKFVMVVESPSKIKTIKKILTELGLNNYSITASYGHITELEKGAKGIDKKTFIPSYVVSPEKKDVVKALKEFKKNGYTFVLASDNDKEGEKISQSIAEVLDLPITTTTRITFNEITKKAIEEALNNPRTIDVDLVKAQEARRIIDRLVGFDLSGLLWKKISANLSAGRVQSIATRLIVEKEREINLFESDVDFKTVGIFLTHKQIPIKSILDKRFTNKNDANMFLNECVGKEFRVLSIEKKDGKKSPVAPFTTSTLQQAASNRLGFSVDRVMLVAQKLYEGGHISYHRSDSVALSDDAVKAISNEITSRYGANYLQTRVFKNKNKSAQNAHEAIRATHFENITAGDDNDQKKLYELIWKRSMASQMSDAKTALTKISIGNKNLKEQFITKGVLITFDGFLKAYNDAEDNKEDIDDDSDSKTLPPLEKGDILTYKDITSAQSFTKPVPRFSEAGLVKDLESKSIGRPSTWATIIKTIQERGYVEKKDIEAKERNVETITLLSTGEITEESKKDKFGGEKAKLVPTEIAGVVVDYLKKHFAEVMDYGFTGETEEKLDAIAEGTKQWDVMLGEFYAPFSKLVKEASGEEGKAGVRELGIDPKTGLSVTGKFGKFGQFIQLGEGDKEAGTKPKFAKLKEGQTLETITLQEALKLLDWPRELGKHKKEDVIVGVGKYGFFVKIGDTYASIPKEEDPAEIDLKRAIEIFNEKSAAKASKTIKEFKKQNILILNGQYGPYIKSKTGNHKIPTGKEADSLTLADCEEIISGSSSKPKSKFKKFKKK